MTTNNTNNSDKIRFQYMEDNALVILLHKGYQFNDVAFPFPNHVRAFTDKAVLEYALASIKPCNCDICASKEVKYALSE